VEALKKNKTNWICELTATIIYVIEDMANCRRRRTTSATMITARRMKLTTVLNNSNVRSRRVVPMDEKIAFSF